MKRILLYLTISACSITIFAQKVNIKVVPSNKDTNVRNVKLITNKEEFKKYFSDSSSYKTLLPPYKIPNTRTWISVPKGFKYSERINGFVHLATTSSIVCKEIKGFYFTTIVDNITPESLDRQNSYLKTIEDVKTNDGLPAKLLTIGFTLNSNDSIKKSTAFERLMLFTGDMESTVWVTATYPEAVKPFIYEMVRKSLLSVKLEQQ